MATLHLLGTGAAFSDGDRTTTMLAVENAGSVIVVDCGGDAVQRLLACGVQLDKIAALIVTHEHADHVSGFPLLMERLWLSGRRDPLPVYGIAPAIDQARRIHDAFDTSSWPGYPGVHYSEVAHEEGAVVLADRNWKVTASPGRHAVPVVALRFQDRHGDGEMTYSCDTEYHEPVGPARPGQRPAGPRGHRRGPLALQRRGGRPRRQGGWSGAAGAGAPAPRRPVG